MPHTIRLEVDFSFNSMTQIKLRLTEADHLILKADLLLRVNHNESD